MKSLLLALLLLSLQAPQPKLTVSPRVTQEPATIVFLLRDIPASIKVACFVLDGPNHYQSCRELFGERSYRLEHKNVYAGEYKAGVTLDGKILQPVQDVRVIE